MQGTSAGKESTCNAGDPSSILGLGRSPGEGIGYPLQYSWASLVAQLVKYPPAMWVTWVQTLGWEDPLEKGTLPTPAFWPGEFHGLYSPWGGKESDTTERLSLHKAGLTEHRAKPERMGNRPFSLDLHNFSHKVCWGLDWRGPHGWIMNSWVLPRACLGAWQHLVRWGVSETVTFCKRRVLSCSIHRGKENISSRAKAISPGNPSLYSCSLQSSPVLCFLGFRLIHALSRKFNQSPMCLL